MAAKNKWECSTRFDRQPAAHPQPDSLLQGAEESGVASRFGVTDAANKSRSSSDFSSISDFATVHVTQSSVRHAELHHKAPEQFF